MSTALQKAIVYELFAIFLALVICAVALAESLTAGYLTGPWIALAVPALIALVGCLRALFANEGAPADTGASGQAESDGGDPDGDEPSEPDTAVPDTLGHPPY